MSDNKDDKPYMMEDGTLVIPFACPDHSYKYWKKEGRKISEILTELNVDKDLWKKYTTDHYPEEEKKEE
ncbi:hypothetical protein [Maridesulfovibrio bastinii]|uniref:hypothetical protein n=1 Tax=Maridesulfovibrio bastinii TaxID=47157 RepID=UPI0004022A6A|nr:hypothetical protein [Maridesulfovibrio bastinii]